MSELTEQQANAVYSVDKNVLVAAGAGSGKTHVLVERYVELLRSAPDLTVEGIVAVTFTRKAAGEMRSRLKARFKSLVDSEPERQERWRQCLADVDSAKIGTIHSLCETILKSDPAESGVDPQFTVLEEVDQATLVDECIDVVFRELVAHAGSDGCPEAQLLVDFDIDDIRRWLTSLLKSNLQFKEACQRFADLSDDDLLGFMNEIRHRVQSHLLTDMVSSREWSESVQFLLQAAWEGRLEEQRLEVLQAAGLIDSAITGGEALDASDTAAIWEQLAAITQINLRIGGNKDGAKAIKKAMKTLRELVRGISKDLPAVIEEDDLQHFASCRWIANLFDRAISVYRIRKEEEMVLDYNDLISLASSTLRIPDSPTRRSYQERIRAILVDEFQDTNSIQAELVSLLAGPQTRLFLIGDDKQSIYKFQGADVSNFNSWRELMGSDTNNTEPGACDVNIEGERLALKLTRSFRSHPSVVGFVNFVFSRLMDGDPTDGSNTSYEAVFEPLTASRSAATDDGRQRVNVTLFNVLDEEERRDAEESKHFESLAVADWILEKIDSQAPILTSDGEVDRALRFGDFAVLVPRNSDFESIEAGLALRNIPFSTFAGRGFLHRQEVLDLESLLYFIGNPRDGHSLLGALRSPMFAISDDIIHELAASRQTAGRTLWDVLKSTDYSRPGYESIRAAVRTLGHMIIDASRITLSELIKSIIVKTSYELVLLSLPGGRQRARNLWKLTSLARDKEHLSCLQFARLMTLMREHEIKLSDAPIGSSDSVKLMTIHASKGLEFPAVALPCLGSALSRGASRLIFHPVYGIALNTARTDDDDVPAWWKYAGKLEQQMELAERRRLLYVAMTRAREYLGLFLEQGVAARESFRLWLMDILQLEEDGLADPMRDPGDGGAAETRKLNNADGEISFSVRRLFKDDLQIEPHVPEGKDQESDAPIKFNPVLVDELPRDSATIPEARHGWTRITPSGDGEEKLDATMLGTYFHSIMENLPVNGSRPDRRYLEDLAFDLGAMVAHPAKLDRLVSEGEKLLSVYLESDLCDLVRTAKQRFNELPYMIRTGTELKSKRPDLVVQDSNGRWFVVDFKTDSFPLNDLETHVRRHQGQLQSYVQDLRGLTGLDPEPAIYFARYGKTVFFNEFFAQDVESAEPENQENIVVQPEQYIQLSLFELP